MKKNERTLKQMLKDLSDEVAGKVKAPIKPACPKMPKGERMDSIYRTFTEAYEERLKSTSGIDDEIVKDLMALGRIKDEGILGLDEEYPF